MEIGMFSFILLNFPEMTTQIPLIHRQECTWQAFQREKKKEFSFEITWHDLMGVLEKMEAIGQISGCVIVRRT